MSLYMLTEARRVTSEGTAANETSSYKIWKKIEVFILFNNSIQRDGQ